MISSPAGRSGGLVVLVSLAAVPALAQVPGGWSKVSVKDPGVVAAARFAIEARLAEARKEGAAGKLALVDILSAEQQVVAGMNYRITMTVKAGDDARKAEATVWARAWLEKDERYQLTAWKFVDEAARTGRADRRAPGEDP